jgi:transcriptional regulator with XRE-family HTH domain
VLFLTGLPLRKLKIVRGFILRAEAMSISLISLAFIQVLKSLIVITLSVHLYNHKVNIFVCLNSKRISKSDLCKQSGIDRVSLDNYLKQKACPRLDAVEKVSEVLGLKPWDIIQKLDEESAEDSIKLAKLIDLLDSFSKSDKHAIIDAFGTLVDAIHQAKKLKTTKPN